MAARDDETWLFVVEWFDPMPRLKRMYLLKYFVQQRQVEMVDVKSKKMFLKKSSCPPEITAEDFAVGKKLLLYSRELDIIDYGDLKTKQKLAHQHQQTVVLLGPDIYLQWGSILDSLNEHLSLVAVKTIYPSIDVAERICQIVHVSNNRSNIDALCKGVCLVLLLSGPAATETAVDVLSKVMATTTTASSVIATQSGAQVSDNSTMCWLLL